MADISSMAAVKAVRKMLEQCDSVDRILDLGTGSGFLIAELLKLRPLPQISTVDCAPPLVREAALRFGGKNLRAMQHLLGAAPLPLPEDEGSFDAVVSAELFSSLSLPELRMTLADAYRALKVGGPAIFGVLTPKAHEVNRRFTRSVARDGEEELQFVDVIANARRNGIRVHRGLTDLEGTSSIFVRSGKRYRELLEEAGFSVGFTTGYPSSHRQLRVRGNSVTVIKALKAP